MSERKKHDRVLAEIGSLLVNRRKALGRKYNSREKFIARRSEEIFQNESWISERYLANIERGTNWISIEKLIQHAYALETDPLTLFAEILTIYNKQ